MVKDRIKVFALNIGKKIRNKISNKITNGSKRVKEIKQIFKETLDETRKKPVSKRKSVLLGFSMGLAIFGFTLLTPVLPVLAKDLSVPGPPGPPGAICPATPQTPTLNKAMNEVIGTFGGSLCTIAIHTGSVALGISCALFVAIAILYVEKKAMQ